MTDLPKTFDPKAIEERWYAHWESRGLFRPDRVQIGRAGLSAAQERPATTVTPSQESDGLRSAAVDTEAEIAAFGTCGALLLAPHPPVQRPTHLPA